MTLASAASDWLCSTPRGISVWSNASRPGSIRPRSLRMAGRCTCRLLKHALVRGGCEDRRSDQEVARAGECGRAQHHMESGWVQGVYGGSTIQHHVDCGPQDEYGREDGGSVFSLRAAVYSERGRNADLCEC